MKVFPYLLFLISFSAYAELLDKIVAVFDNKSITLSEIKRIEQNFSARKTMAAQKYAAEKANPTAITQSIIQTYVIREKLNEMNRPVRNEQVEGEIDNFKKRMNASQEELVDFLKHNGVTFQEYTELVRESLEYTLFNYLVIRPLIFVSDDELKKEFYKENEKNKSISFKYYLVDFFIKDPLTADEVTDLPAKMDIYRKTGKLPKKFSNLEAEDIGSVSEEGLTPQIVNAIRDVPEEHFSKPVLIEKLYHVYFVKKKDPMESTFFGNEKNRLRDKIYVQKFNKVVNEWCEREKEKHYVKVFPI